MSDRVSCKYANNLNTSFADSPPASADAMRQRDAQDIRLDKAPSGQATGHRRRKPGPKKKHPRTKANWLPNKFGKYPASSAVKKHLEAIRKYYAPSTFTEKTRKLKYIVKTMAELGISPDPTKISETDMIKYLDWMDSHKFSNGHKRKLMNHLRDYLAWYDNDVIGRMKSKKQLRIPREIQNEIRSLCPETIKQIHDATLTMTGWEGVIARFITMAYPYTGLRPSELRTLRYRDLDQRDWIITVSHPKGEGRYGQNRRVGILPQAIPTFQEFLRERATYLMDNNLPEDYEHLIPYKGQKGFTCWGWVPLEKLKLNIEKASGVKFRIKDYRASYCQMAIDNGASLQAVSKQMGHASTRTSELYYGRIRDDSAIREVRRAFTEPSAQSLIHS